MSEREKEEFLFNLFCLGEYEMREVGEWIYFIHAKDLSPEGDDTIWRIRPDGSDLRKIQRSNVQVRGIVGTDEKWIYFVTKEQQSTQDMFSGLRICRNYCKMTLLGGLERCMTISDFNIWSDEIEEIEENY